MSLLLTCTVVRAIARHLLSSGCVAEDRGVGVVQHVWIGSLTGTAATHAVQGRRTSAAAHAGGQSDLMLWFTFSPCRTAAARRPGQGLRVAVEPIEQRRGRVRGRGDAGHGLAVARVARIQVGKTIVGIEEFVTPLAVGGGPERAFDSLGHARLLLLTLDAHLLLDFLADILSHERLLMCLPGIRLGPHVRFRRGGRRLLPGLLTDAAGHLVHPPAHHRNLALQGQVVLLGLTRTFRFLPYPVGRDALGLLVGRLLATLVFLVLLLLRGLAFLFVFALGLELVFILVDLGVVLVDEVLVIEMIAAGALAHLLERVVAVIVRLFVLHCLPKDLIFRVGKRSVYVGAVLLFGPPVRRERLWHEVPRFVRKTNHPFRRDATGIVS